VRASNSSLEQILREIGAQTGVQIQGVPGDERVFGNFGPGPADRVLAQLLDGSDSNYLMLGRTADHAPKTLVITPRTSLAPGAQTAEAAQPTPAGADDDDDDDAAPPPRPPIRPLIPNGAEVTIAEQSNKDITVRGARQHNLRNISVTIPRNSFTVVTGLSGSQALASPPWPLTPSTPKASAAMWRPSRPTLASSLTRWSGPTLTPSKA
jgi:hypothetical protein